MATIYDWKSGTTGDWSTAKDWAGGVAPNSAVADVTIAGTGSKVTISSGESFTADSVTIGTGATLDVVGLLNLSGVTDELVVSGGVLDIGVIGPFNGGGTVANGTIVASNGTVVFGDHATLEDITYRGNLNVTANYYDLNIVGGLKVLNANGGGPGTINLTGFENSLHVNDSETLDNVGINLGAAGQRSTDSVFLSNSYTELTFGSHAVINSNGLATNNIYSSYYCAITNDGIINVAGAGLYIGPSYGTFTNAGIINVAGSAALAIGGNSGRSSRSDFANTGIINVGAGSKAILDVSTLVNGAGTINVGGTLDLAGSAMQAALGFVSVASGGLLVITGSLDLDGGTLGVGGTDNIEISERGGFGATGGTVANGTIIAGAGTVVLGNVATLEDITYKGNLNVTTNNYYLNIVGGLKVVNANGTSPGTINLTGVNDTLNVLDSETLDNVGINLTGNDELRLQNNSTLSFGSHAVINSSGNSANAIYSSYRGAITNDGIINVAGAGLNIYSYYGMFTNAGIINVAGNAALTIGSKYNQETFANTGIINVSAGSQLILSVSTFVSGVGTINVGGTLDLAGSATLAALDFVSLASSGLLDVTGSLDLGGGTLGVGGTDNIEIGNADQFGSGTVANGTIVADAGTVTFGGGATLEDITYKGNLNVTANFVALNIVGDLKVLNASGGSPGTINLIGFDDNLYVRDSETLDNVGINLGAAGSGDDGLYLSNSRTQLTFGSQAVISSTGINPNYIYSSYHSGITNDGIINVAGASALGIGGSQGTFTNSGLIEGNGAGTASVNITVANFKNLASGKLTGGAFEAAASDTLALNLNGTVVTTNDATLILGGVGSEIEFFKTSTGKYVTVESALTSIGTGGTLEVLGGRNYTTANALTLTAGTLALGGGTFAAGTLNLATLTSRIAGFGTVKDSIANAGTIEAASGVLVITGSVSGAGALLIDSSATLELGAGTAENVTFTGQTSLHSTLKLDAPASYTGTLVGLGLGDVIDIAGTTVSATSSSGTNLLITLSSGGTLTETLSSALPANQRIGIAGDGGSGSNLTVFQEAQAGSIGSATVDFGQQHVGAALGEFYTISNTGPAGSYTENLDASFSAGSGALTTSGSLTGLAGGASNGTALAASLNTAGPGTVSGTGVINLYTDGTGVPGDGLGTLAIGTQSISQTATLFNYATAATVAPVGFGQHHVGDALSQFITIGNAAAPGIYSEGLDASFSGTSANLTGSGGVTTLAAGGTSGSALAVTLNSATAGVQTGVATLALASDGAGIDTLGTTALAAQTVAASGTLFNYATAAAATLVNFGIVHVGQAGVSQAVVLGNIATPGLFSEGLDAGFSGTSIGFTSSGSVSGLAAGGTSGTALNIGLATNKAGVFGGTTTLGLVSDGAGIDSLGTTVLGSDTISLAGTVNNYATVGLDLISGPGKLTVNGATTLSLNLGTVVKGGADPAENIGIVNAARGPADLLSGSLSLSGSTSAFIDNSAISFSGIAAGSTSTGHTISLKTTNIGTFSETIVLHASGSNASGYSGTLAAETFIVTGTVTAAAAVSSGAGAMRFMAPAAGQAAPAAAAVPMTGQLAWLRLPALAGGATRLAPAAAPAEGAVAPTVSAAGLLAPYGQWLPGHDQPAGMLASQPGHSW